MEYIQRILSKDLDPEVRTRFNWRVDAMIRHLRYFQEEKADYISQLNEYNWPINRLEVICVLNSFYQTVIAPLASSAIIEGPNGLGTSIPILYGETIKFDEIYKNKVKSALLNFLSITKSAGISRRVLQANKLDDMLYYLTDEVENDEY